MKTLALTILASCGTVAEQSPAQDFLIVEAPAQRPGQTYVPEGTTEIQVIPVDNGGAFSVSTQDWLLTFAPGEKMEWTPINGTIVVITNYGIVATNYAIFYR